MAHTRFSFRITVTDDDVCFDGLDSSDKNKSIVKNTRERVPVVENRIIEIRVRFGRPGNAASICLLKIFQVPLPLILFAYLFEIQSVTYVLDIFLTFCRTARVGYCLTAVTVLAPLPS